MKVLTLIAVIAATLCRVPAQAQEPRPTFRSGVQVVPITVVVRNARNAIVRDLTREDFEVLENGVPRPIVGFSSTDQASVTIGLLVDTSGSMRGRTLDIGRLIVDTLLDALDRDADEISLFTFDRSVQQQTPFTGDPGATRRALDGIRTWGLTSLYDGVAETARRVRDRTSERRAVVVITDGLDTSSTLTAPEVSGLASAIDVPVYVIPVVPPSRSEAPSPQAARDYHLANLAYWTGGDVVHVTDVDAAAKAIERLMAELRQQYAITIESAQETGWQRLEVRTKRRGLSVRARIGYYATPAAAPGSD
jgi:Ca-activated chloride channel homolog